MHTKDKLADALRRIGLFDMSLQARDGYYHDFLSPLAAPELQLANDLAEAASATTDQSVRKAILALRQQVINGDFDATSEESEQWAGSPDGQATMSELMKGKRKP